MSIEGDPAKKQKKLEKEGEAWAAVYEVAVQSIFVNSLPQIMENESRWKAESPTVVLEALLKDIPDTPKTIPRSSLSCSSLHECQVMLRESQKPSALEAYFLFKIVGSDPKVLQFDSVAEGRGNSLPPAGSIMCLRDGVRTKKFTGAIKKAIEELDHTDGAPIRVIDAGCGAIPIMGVYAALCSPHVVCVCLEMNPESANIARQVISSLGLEDRISVLVQDATEYVPEQPVDLVISETMNTGLLSEPLCDIMDHLAPHVRPAGIMLPDKVQTVAASVPSVAYEGAEELIHIYGNASPKVNADWQETGMYIPGQLRPRLQATIAGSATENEARVVMVASRVSLMGDILDVYDSLLSIPQPVAVQVKGEVVPKKYVTKVGEHLQVSYLPGEEVGEIGVARV